MLPAFRSGPDGQRRHLTAILPAMDVRLGIKVSPRSPSGLESLFAFQALGREGRQ